MTATIPRPLRGSRITTFYPIKSLPSLASLDSAFQLQEYISLLIRLDIHDVEAITSLPGKDKDASSSEDEKEGEKVVAVDEACWVYEQLRRLAQDLTQPLITTLQQECTRQSCPEMKAGEWLYLCVAHGNEGSMEQCCAIDYILHTLDSATALLNSPRAFPSRLQIPATSHRHFSSLARRLGRIFAHAYFHHREAFEQAEVESSLYARFLALSSKFELVPPEFLPIPPEAFAANGEEGYEQDLPRDIPLPRLLAASLDPASSSQASDHSNSNSYPVQEQQQQPLPPPSSSSSQQLGLTVPESKGPSPPGLGVESSPRRQGRSRTDTMVHSEASQIIEDLALRAAEVEAESPVISSPAEEFTPEEGVSEPVIQEETSAPPVESAKEDDLHAKVEEEPPVESGAATWVNSDDKSEAEPAEAKEDGEPAESADLTEVSLEDSSSSSSAAVEVTEGASEQAPEGATESSDSSGSTSVESTPVPPQEEVQETPAEPSTEGAPDTQVAAEVNQEGESKTSDMEGGESKDDSKPEPAVTAPIAAPAIVVPETLETKDVTDPVSPAA